MQETRAALGVHIRGNVLIVDEAHNLVDAVNGAHSSSMAAVQLRAAEGQLSGYYQRFRTRLAPGDVKRFTSLGQWSGDDLMRLKPYATGSSL